MSTADVSPRRTVAEEAAPAHTGAGWKPADPGPLGLAAFAATTFVLSVYNADLVGAASIPVFLGLALAYGGIVQVLAGMWEFRTGNTFGAVAFCSYGAFWLSLWAIEQFYAPTIIKLGGAEAFSHGAGLFLWAWAIFTIIMLVASLRTSGALIVVFVLLAITFILLAIGRSGLDTGIVKAGGWFGIATAIAAWYAAAAAVVNGTWGRTVLPVFPMRR